MRSTTFPAMAGSKRTLFWILGAVGAVAICVIGALAALSVASLDEYADRSRTAEATSNLQAMFQGASAYYAREHVSGAVGLQSHSSCSVDPAATPHSPGAELKPISDAQLPESFRAIGFASSQYRYAYEIAGEPGRCGHDPERPLYTFRARGDLDEDGELSLFELAVGIDGSNMLYRAPGVFTENEHE